MNSRNIAFIGAGVLVAGLFTPIVTLPFLGNVNLFNNGTNLIGVDLLLIAAIAAGLAAKSRIRDVIWPGVAAAAVLLYEFGTLEFRLTQMREALSKELQGNPFAGLAQGALSAIQLQWGWLVLASGAGLLVYAAMSAPKEDDAPAINLREGLSRSVAAVSVLLFLFVPAWDFLHKSPSAAANVGSSETSSRQTNATDSTASTISSDAPTAEEAAYINQNMRLYDLRTKYYDSMLDGRVPGVDFKIQNNGNRTLNKVTVRVVFYDAKGNPISEQEYTPVIVSEYSVGDNTPLRPHYIWQQSSDQFYEAKNVPTEWAEGKATATIVDIEFAKDG